MHLIAGVDEAGRGPLAGPVVAAVVVLRDRQLIPGVTDSKKLSPRRRETLSGEIRNNCVAWCIASATPAEIDRLNILHATMLAMHRALTGLLEQPDIVRVDGNRLPEKPENMLAPMEALVRGDALCPAIGAASILAKVERDRLMLELHAEYPGYGFDRHKGYPTKQHRRALQELGPTPAHRRSFRPVSEALAAAGSPAG